jgi:amino acid adenylation domain-containing protein
MMRNMSDKKVIELISDLRRQDVKLWLDGDRLRYRAGKDSLNPELLAQLKVQKNEIINFLRSIKVQSNSLVPPLEPVDRRGNLPLSFGQQRLWFVHQFEPSSSANNVPVTVRLTGNLSIPALEESLHEIAMRHEVLRTSFPLVDGNPVQSIAPDFPKSLPIVDLKALSPAERQEEARRISALESRKPFDLEHGPIVRFMLLKFDDRDHLLIRNMHCIICDGASCDLFYEELISLYTAFSNGQPSPLDPLPIQYADFSVWQRQWLQGEILETQVNYWRQKLSGSLSTIQLPYDRPRPQGAQAYLGNSRGLMLPKSLNQALTQLSQQCGATLFMLLLAAFEVFLHRYSGQEDLLISFASAARGQVETERLLGFFSNTLFLRTKLERQLTFRELLDRVRQDCVDAYNHQDIPFEKLVEEIKPEQNQDRSPLFQTKFTLNLPWSEGRGVTKVELPDLQIAPQTGYVYPGQTKYDLILVVREQDEGLRTVFDYNADLFDVTTINRMLGHMQNLLEGIVANPDCPISELPLLTKPEQQQLLEWNQTQTEYPAKCIHQLFEEQVQRTPDAVAVVFENQQLTYQELNDRSNQLANYLRTLGVEADVPVGICIERSLAMVVGLLGILKAGGAYVPLDPAYPQARLAHMLENSQIAVLLTSQQSVNELPPHHVSIVNLDIDWAQIAQQSSENLDITVEPDRLSYVIYTSGSTGTPKGVAMTQRAISNLISWQLKQPRGQDCPKTIQFAPISFDVSCQEIFATWCAGGTLVLISEQLRLDPLALLQKIDRHQIDRLFLPVVALQQLAQVAVSHELFPIGLRDIITAGEQLKITPAIQSFFTKLDNCTLHNHYGPTESHVVTALTLSESVENWPTLPSIGQPIANTQIYILSPDLQPVPIGTSGELYIGGDCLARGYFNRPDLTAERFIPNPFGDQRGDTSRLYKTGDVARYLQDGNIEYLGRIDDQVKIRGFRIELGEIETLLAQHPAISQTTVAVREDLPGDRRLVAYYVVNGNTPPTHNELCDFVAQKVPNYMVPSMFVMLSSLPISPNGKIDRRALPAPDYIRPESENTFVAPRNELERQLAQIWQKILGIESIGIRDNFFELGGHSLIAVRLFAEIEQTWGKNLPLATLFQAQSIEKLADVMSQQGWVDPWSSLVTIQPHGSKPPLFFLHAIGGNILEYYPLAHHLGNEQPMYGLQSQGLDGQQQLLTSVEDMASHYIKDILSIQPDGPYFLVGYSFGGLLAFEIAQQLHSQGKKVALLALLDIKSPNFQRIRPSLAQFIQINFSNLRQLPPNRKLKYITDRLDYRFNKKFDYKADMIKDLSKISPPTPELLNLIDTNMQAAREYTAQIYPGDVSLFRCQVQSVGSYLSGDLGWGQIVAGKLEIYNIANSHYDLLKEPMISIIVEKLKICLEKARARATIL